MNAKPLITIIMTRRVLLIILLAFSCFSWGHSAWIYSKAIAAQWLIEHAWNTQLESGHTQPPWPWADTQPIARLTVKNQIINEDLYVLAGSHGSSLAFGPGHIDGTAQPGEHGTTVLSGHRDTHFHFLENISINDTLSLQDTNGRWHNYRVHSQHIISTDDGPWHVATDEQQLHLITCYPFNATIPGGKLRHVTIAEKLAHNPILENHISNNFKPTQL